MANIRISQGKVEDKSNFRCGEFVRVEGYDGLLEIRSPGISSLGCRIPEPLPECLEKYKPYTPSHPMLDVDFIHVVEAGLDKDGVKILRPNPLPAKKVYYDLVEPIVEVVHSEPVYEDPEEVVNPDFDYENSQDPVYLYNLTASLREAGFSVVPIRGKGIKSPACSWGDWCVTPMTPTEHSHWFGKKNSPVGIICGQVSGNLEVIDFDDFAAWKAWKSIVKVEHPDLWDKLVISRTPDNGRHVLIRSPFCEGNQVLAGRLTKHKTKPAPATQVEALIETRGEGGLIVSPGSQSDTHPTGRAYRFVQGDPRTLVPITSEERELLFEIARRLTELCPSSKAESKPSAYNDVPEAETSEGDYVDNPDKPWGAYNLKGSWESLLAKHGWEIFTGDWEAGGTVTRPGKSEGVSASFGLHGKPLFYCFSTSTEFEAEKSYDKFAVYSKLEHDDNHSLAASALYHLGYGKRWEDKNSELNSKALDLELPPMVVESAPFSAVPLKKVKKKPKPVKVAHGTVVNASDTYRLANTIVDQIYRHEKKPTLRHRGGLWYYWNGAVYVEAQPENIRTDLYEWFAGAKKKSKDKDDKEVLAPFAPHRKIVTDTVDALRAVCEVREEGMPIFLGEGDFVGSDVISLENGILDTNRFLRGEPALMPHTPEWFSTNCLPFDFDPDAKCPVWDKYMDDVMGKDQQGRETLQEWMGYNLIADNRYQMMMMLIGTGANGKGVFTRTLQKIIGESNFTTSDFTSVSKQFGLEDWVGKLAAFFSDAHLTKNADVIRTMEVLKSISGGDRVSIDRKNRVALGKQKLNTRITIVANEMPKFPDASRAMARRFLYLPFHENFEGREDPTLEDRIETELPGILLWALKGLARLRQRGRFVQPESGVDFKEEIDRDSSPLRAFLTEYCEQGPTLSEKKDTFRDNFNAWLTTQGNPTWSASTISLRLKAANSRISTQRKREAGIGQVYYFQGVALTVEAKKLLRSITKMPMSEVLFNPMTVV